MAGMELADLPKTQKLAAARAGLLRLLDEYEHGDLAVREIDSDHKLTSVFLPAELARPVLFVLLGLIECRLEAHGVELPPR